MSNVRTDFVIEARLLAGAFDLSESDVRTRMREGRITSRCETGVDEDAGRLRLTFYHWDRACRFIVDEAGIVLKKATFQITTGPRFPPRITGNPGRQSPPRETENEPRLATRNSRPPTGQNRPIRAVQRRRSDVRPSGQACCADACLTT